MTDRETLETRLEVLLRSQAELAVRPSDAVAIARQAAQSSRRASLRWRMSAQSTTGSGIRSTRMPLVAAMLIALLAGLALAGALVGGQLRVDPDPAIRGVFTTTPPMGYESGSGRLDSWTATRLLDGRVLVAGGYGLYVSADLFDPRTDTWDHTGDLAHGRYGHVAVLLPDGRVLVAGGVEDAIGEPARALEVWDPTTGLWHVAGELAVPPGDDLAVDILPDGRVLIGPGEGAERWDPGTEVLSPAGLYRDEPRVPAGPRLPDGRIVTVGGETLRTVDPATGQSAAVDVALPHDHSPIAATMTADGLVIVFVVIGEQTCVPADEATASLHTAGLLHCTPPPVSADIWDPNDGAIVPTRALTDGSDWQTITQLLDGRTLIVGRGDSVIFELVR